MCDDDDDDDDDDELEVVKRLHTHTDRQTGRKHNAFGGPQDAKWRHKKGKQWQLEGKYSLESTDPRESEIRTPPQPLPYLMPIPPNTPFL